MKHTITGASLALALSISQPTYADDVDCIGTIDAKTVDGNVLVATRCELDGTTVKGNVELFEGGQLVARNVEIIGNLQAANAASADVADSDIGGSVQLDELTGDISIARNRIEGSIQVVGNWSPIALTDNVVGADVQAFSNTGGVDIVSNTIDGNLQCKENDPAPTGDGNQVGGNMEDQCEGFGPADNSSDRSGDSDDDPPALAAGGVQTASASAATAGAPGGGGGGPMHLSMLAGLLLIAGARNLRRRG